MAPKQYIKRQSMQTQRRRAIVTELTTPCFERGVRLHHDWARERDVLLAPERVVVLDQSAFDILALCDGRTVSSIVDTLSAHYRADYMAVMSDTRTMLQGLFDKRYLTESGQKSASSRHAAQPRSGKLAALNLPIAVLAELTHRCPLQCPYCSNPVALERDELSNAEWERVIDEIASLGVLQVHFSGGEPTARKGLTALVERAAGLGLYTNLITSGVLLNDERLLALALAGLDHVQISFQDAQPEQSKRISPFADSIFAKP